MIQPLTDTQLTEYFNKRREYFEWDRKVHKPGDKKPDPKEVEGLLGGSKPAN